MTHSLATQNLFEVFGRDPVNIVPEVNNEALSEIEELVRERSGEVGRLILLRSPKAGHGKTHLLKVLKIRLGDDFRCLAAEPTCGGRLDAGVVLESLLRQLTGILPASGGLTELDFFTRKLLARGLRPLLVSGEIPSHDREGAIFALENRPIETFDFHHQQAATAHWTQSNFEVLGPRLASELSESAGSTLRDTAYWVELLFHYATTPPERVERTRQLSDAVFADLEGHAKGMVEERLQALIGLLGLVLPVVLIFDETEGLSNHPEEGLRVAAFLVQMRQACPALTVILSVNRDVWDTGLAPLMPGGLRDRLTEHTVELNELSPEVAIALVKGRFGSDAAEILTKLDLTGVCSAREVVREASKNQRILLNARGESPTATTMQAMPPALPVITEEISGDFEERSSDSEPDFASHNPSASADQPVGEALSYKQHEVDELTSLHAQERNPLEATASFESPFKPVVEESPFQATPSATVVETEVELPRTLHPREENPFAQEKTIIDVEPAEQWPVAPLPPDEIPDPFGLRTGTQSPALPENESPVFTPQAPPSFEQLHPNQIADRPWHEAVATPPNPFQETVSSPPTESPTGTNFQTPPSTPAVESPFRVAEVESAPAFHQNVVVEPTASSHSPEKAESIPHPLQQNVLAEEARSPLEAPPTSFQPEATTWSQAMNQAWEKPETVVTPPPVAEPPLQAEARQSAPPFFAREVDLSIPPPPQTPAPPAHVVVAPEPPAAPSAEETFAASPFASTPSRTVVPNLDDETAKVEDLLNQFKRRFGGE